MAQAIVEKPKGGMRVLLRFLPMLWPRGEIELKVRVVAALLLVLLGKAAVLLMPFAYKAVIDQMSGRTATFAMVAGLVLGYCTARFAGVLSDNLRNAVFEKVGQNAARRLAGQVFRHIHDLSLRDALFPAVQHRADADRTGRDLRHLPH
jgi:ATP-binding cassette subfamily B protein